MRGRIYSDQKCSICESSFIQNEHRRGLFCPDHQDQRAASRFIVQFGRQLRKRFKDYLTAERFLDGLRYEVDRGTFDVRDYLSSNPLSFTVLSEQWLKKQKGKITHRYHVNVCNYIRVAQKFFGDTNVKAIQYAQLEDYSESLSCSNKTKSNYISCLHTFFKWLLQRREINKTQFPEFPTISYELAFRRTVDKETQQAIIDRVKEISYKVNPKIWLGLKWLSTYISIRPAELRNIKEGHIDLKQGFVFIPHPKEKRPKIVPLLDEDIKLLQTFPRAFPELYFFRHNSFVSGVKAGSRFGQKIFYKWWKRACDDLGIKNVDMYGGTRHSSAVDLRQYATPEEIRRATMHTTNKAFERYFQVSRAELQQIYGLTRCDTAVTPNGKVKNRVRH